MQHDDVQTPARRIYFPVMMMYLDEGNAEKYYGDFVTRLTEFMGVISNPNILADCVDISRHCMEREYYKALMGWNRSNYFVVAVGYLADRIVGKS